MRILGIDPGLAIVGFGLIEAETGKTQMLQYGAVTTPAGLPLAARLVQLSQSILDGCPSPDLFPDGPCSRAEPIYENWYKK